MDTEPVHNRVLSDELMSLGLSAYTPKKCEDVFLGTALDAICAMVEDVEDITLPADFKDRVIDHTVKSMENGIALEDSTRGVLEILAQSRIKMAVGSNGNPPAVLASLKAAGFDKYFPDENVYTFKDVARPKPAPDLYLHICDRFGVDPGDALVVEDTVKGAMAGINANIDTVGYTGLTHRDNQAERLRIIGCKYNIKTMSDLLGIVDL